MKRTVLSLLILTFVVLSSCQNKKEAQPDSASGLTPANFATTTAKGEKINLYVLKNAAGMEVCVTNIGARIVSIMVPDKNGELKNVVLGHDNIEPYMQLTDYYGAVLGRYAGRIANGEISVNRVTYHLRTNDKDDIVNGGPRGFSTQYFDIVRMSDSELVASYLSRDKEEGFPGNLNLTVTYKVTEDNALDVTYEATTDWATVINVTNHSCFNLSGIDSGSLNDHQLFVDATYYLPVNENKIPSGRLENVEKTPFDFTTAKALEPNFDYDHCLVLNNPIIDNRSGKLVSTTTGISLEIYTTEPGVQLSLEKTKPAVYLDTQHFSDSPNHKIFPTTVLQADSLFQSQTIYKFGIER